MNWVLTLMVPKWALANAQLGVNFVPDMAPEPGWTALLVTINIG